MNTTPEALIKEYADPIEQQEIDKFVCAEMGRQIHLVLVNLKVLQKWEKELKS